MPGQYIQLSYGQLAIATSLILISGLISLVLGLGLERRLALASVRTVVQLLLVGKVLEGSGIDSIAYWGRTLTKLARMFMAVQLGNAA